MHQDYNTEINDDRLVALEMSIESHTNTEEKEFGDKDKTDIVIETAERFLKFLTKK